MIKLLLKLKGVFNYAFKNKTTAYIIAVLIVLLTVGIGIRACNTARTIKRATQSSNEARAHITRAIDGTATVTQELITSTTLNRETAYHLDEVQSNSENITEGIAGIIEVSKRIKQIISNIEKQK